MSTRNNQLPPPVEPPFPEEDPENETLPAISSNMSLAQIDSVLGRMTTLEDLIEAGIPQQVAQDMIDSDVTGGAPAGVVNDLPADPQVRRAEPVLKPTGAFMDLGFIEQINNAPTDEEAKAMYDSLDPAMRRVYDRSYGMNVSPEWAAGVAQEFYKEQDRQKSPEVKLAETRLNAIEQGTKEDAQKTYQRADNMIFLLDNLRGGPRDKVPKEKEKWRSRVGSVQGRWPTIISSEETLGWNADFSSLKGAINLTEAQGNKGQGPLSDGERVLMAQAASLGLEQARDEPGFEKAFERMYDMALDAKNKAQAKLSGSNEATGTQPAAQPGAAPQASPSAAPAAAPGFQPGKIYRDGQGRPARFRGYDAQGNPIFDKVQ
jgi:hypothetical protein